ncbi:MAG: family 20 glycosylhydrolase [Candidatus Coatesbacteria bacterium]
MVRPLAPGLILALVLAAAPVGAVDRPTVTPVPRVGEWVEGLGSVAPVTVVPANKVRSPEAKALMRAFAGRLPEAGLPAEGYLLEVGPAGALVIARDGMGALRAAQTLRQLPQEPGACPRIRMADWPDLKWRGLHVLDSGPDSLPRILRLIHEVLAKEKCNVFIYEIDFNYQFTSHPEMAQPGGWSRSQVGELVRACAAEGIRLIPQINCLGHQGWGANEPGRLLKVHPEFWEIPDGKIPMTRTWSGNFYCHSWCPRAPGVHQLVFDLADELMDAFQSDAFHVGMDEVFVIASDACPRCQGANPAEIFAKTVNEFHDHLKAKGKTMFMWADRFLDGRKTGYGDWAAATNGTAPAIDKVPKDIVMCDWHYDARDSYPSIAIFGNKGFRVWPTVYSSLRGARAFMAKSRGKKNVLGVLTSIWIPADRMTVALLEGAAPHRKRRHGGDDEPGIAQTAVAGLDDAWGGPPKDEVVVGPEKPAFLDAVTVTLKARPGAVIRYTLDGSPVTPSSSKYTHSLRLTESVVITAAVVRGKNVSVRASKRAYERLVPREPDGAAAMTPGLDWAVYLAPEVGWERMPDFATLTPTGKGTATAFGLSMAPRELNYGVVFAGYVDVPRDGLWTFTLSSDDGSQLFVGDKMVVDNDGLHQMDGVKGEIALKAGKHAVKVFFFQKEGGADLELAWEGPGLKKRQVVPAKAWWRP